MSIITLEWLDPQKQTEIKVGGDVDLQNKKLSTAYLKNTEKISSVIIQQYHKNL